MADDDCIGCTGNTNGTEITGNAASGHPHTNKQRRSQLECSQTQTHTSSWWRQVALERYRASPPASHPCSASASSKDQSTTPIVAAVLFHTAPSSAQLSDKVPSTRVHLKLWTQSADILLSLLFIRPTPFVCCHSRWQPPSHRRLSWLAWTHRSHDTSTAACRHSDCVSVCLLRIKAAYTASTAWLPRHQRKRSAQPYLNSCCCLLSHCHCMYCTTILEQLLLPPQSLSLHNHT
jgi:hypothetical protein